MYDLNEVRTFVSVMETGSLKESAQKLGVSKSTLSRRINHLEHALSQPLLRRQANRLFANEAGIKFLPFAKKMLTVADEGHKAVEELKEGKEPSLDDLLREQTEVEMRMPALLPDEYIPDVNTRLSMYKRIARVSSASDLSELKVELIDRFGLLPDATKNLLSVSELKVAAAPIKVKKIEAHDKGGYIEFYPDADINPMYLVKLLQSQPQKFAMEGPTKLKFTIPLVDRRKRIQFIADLLSEFRQNLMPA